MGGGGVAMRTGVIANGRGGRFSAMNSLTPKQQAFVTAYVANGGSSTQAAETAGYVDPKGTGWHLLRHEGISAAIRDEQVRAFGRLANKAIGTLEDVMCDKTVAPNHRVAAARTVLEAAGHIGRARKDEDKGGGKPLAEMSLAELHAFIAAEKRALAALEDVTPAAEIEGFPPGLAPDGPVSDAEWSAVPPLSGQESTV